MNANENENASEVDTLIFNNGIIDLNNREPKKYTKYYMKHKFIEKIIKIVDNKLLMPLYIEFFDNYKSSSPQVVLFITDLKKFFDKNKSNVSYCSSYCPSLSYGNKGQTLMSNFTNSGNSFDYSKITLGDILGVVSLSNLQSIPNTLMKWWMSILDYKKICSYINVCVLFDSYREYYMFGDKELISLCMRIDFANEHVYNFGLDVIRL